MKKILIHGGSSLISKSLIEKFLQEANEFYIFCRNVEKTKLILKIDQFKNIKFNFFENNLENLDETILKLNKIPNNIDGVLWVTGFTGNPQIEIENLEKAKYNLDVNFKNVVICLIYLLKKINFSKDSFICVITSVAGLRGRKKRLLYGACKAGLINFLSGLRQHLSGKIKVITVIPGYISTNAFAEKAFKFFVSSPQEVSEVIYESIKRNKEIIYTSKIWKYIMWLVLLIPEKIFKKLNF